MMLYLLRIFCLVAVSAYAQTAFFQSIDDLKSIPDPTEHLSHSFIWRVMGTNGFKYYPIEINNLLFQNKKVFLWPKEMPVQDRIHIQLTNTHTEIIFNARIILSDEDSLKYMREGKSIAFMRVNPPGLALITSNIPALTQKIFGDSLGPEQELPLFDYTINDSTTLQVLHAKGMLPQIIDPHLHANTYKLFPISFQAIPKASFTEHPLPVDSLRSIGNDSLKLIAIDQQLQQYQSWFREDSLRMDSCLNAAAQSIATPTRKLSAWVLQRIRSEVRDSVSNENGFPQILLTIQEKIQYLLTLRKEVMAAKIATERYRQGNPMEALLFHNFYRRIYWGAKGIIGRSMPTSASNPGPNHLWGMQGFISWTSIVRKRFILEPRVDFTYVRWQFNQDEWQHCHQTSLGATYNVNLPLMATAHLDTADQPMSGAMLMVSAGPTVQMRNTLVNRTSTHTNPQDVSLGAVLGLHVALGVTPIKIDLAYTYTLDDYGDLALGFSLPLPNRLQIGGKQ